MPINYLNLVFGIIFLIVGIISLINRKWLIIFKKSYEKHPVFMKTKTYNIAVGMILISIGLLFIFKFSLF
jgi:hypothetical protein